jgi:hypothetical protein
MRRWENTRRTFANPERIRKAVLAKQKTFDGTLEGWWRNKYRSQAEWRDRTKGDLIEEYYWDLVIRRDDLEATWKREGGEQLARQITKLNKALQGMVAEEGLSGDPWLDDWDGEEEEEEPPPKPDPPEEEDDWKDVVHGRP